MYFWVLSPILRINEINLDFQLEKMGSFLIFKYIPSQYTTETYFADPQYINYSETWYLEEGFLGIQIGAIALTSWDHLEKDWNFSKM